jgi:hypothetical protein
MISYSRAAGAVIFVKKPFVTTYRDDYAIDLNQTPELFPVHGSQSEGFPRFQKKRLLP